MKQVSRLLKDNLSIVIWEFRGNLFKYCLNRYNSRYISDVKAYFLKKFSF